MIENVTKGICQGRAWEGRKDCFFVQWVDDGKNQYEFYRTVYEMYKKYDSLIEKQNTKTL